MTIRYFGIFEQKTPKTLTSLIIWCIQRAANKISSAQAVLIFFTKIRKKQFYEFRNGLEINPFLVFPFIKKSLASRLLIGELTKTDYIFVYLGVSR